MSAIGAMTFGSLTCGPSTKINISGIDGLDDLPDVLATDVSRPFDHGAWAGSEYASTRSVVVNLHLRGDDETDLGSLVEQVSNAFTVGSVDQTLTFRDGQDTVFARVRRRALPYNAQALDRFGSCIVEFVCVDPRVYAPAQSYTAPLATATQLGIGFNTGFDISFGGGGQTSGSATLTNDGNIDGMTEFTISAGSASLANPIIEHVGYGFLFLDVILEAGQTITVKPKDRVVLLGAVPRRDIVRIGSTWPSLPVGGATYRFTSTTTGTNATMTVTGRSARL